MLGHAGCCMQADAKKAVANALRNRWRRRKIASPMKVKEIFHALTLRTHACS